MSKNISMDNKSDVLLKFGDRVRQLRKEKSFSQEKLADLSELHRTYIGMIERGEKNITLVNLSKIANALEISISELTNFKYNGLEEFKRF